VPDDADAPASELIHHPAERPMGPVLHLDPMVTTTSAVRPFLVLGDQPFQPHIASCSEQVPPDLALFEGREMDAICAPRQEPCKARLPHAQRQLTERSKSNLIAAFSRSAGTEALLISFYSSGYSGAKTKTMKDVSQLVLVVVFAVVLLAISQAFTHHRSSRNADVPAAAVILRADSLPFPPI
jgi:hypothetical protein